MDTLTSELLGRACRVYLSLAYPDGDATIPEKRRVYLQVSADPNLPGYLPGGKQAQGIAQVLKNEEGEERGYTFRLGCAHFPHLKMQMTFHADLKALVFAVDTHDALPPTGILPPEHADYQNWLDLQKRNQVLKEAIEQAWDRAGLWTFHRMLREDLNREA